MVIENMSHNIMYLNSINIDFELKILIIICLSFIFLNFIYKNFIFILFMGNVSSSPKRDEDGLTNNHGTVIPISEIREPLEHPTSKEENLAEQLGAGSQTSDVIIEGTKEGAKNTPRSIVITITPDNTEFLVPDSLKDEIRKNNEDLYNRK